jgi:hypothetical protein
MLIAGCASHSAGGSNCSLVRTLARLNLNTKKNESKADQKPW